MADNSSHHSDDPNIIDLEQYSSDHDQSSVDQLESQEASSVKKDLLTNLENIKAGPLAGFNRLQNLPDPQFQLGESTIGIPLREEDSRTIIHTAHSASSAKGEQPIAESDVGKVWELKTDRFKITNPKWDEYLKDVVSKVAREMNPEWDGRDCGFHAELDRMLLHEPGAVFEDQPNAIPGMFGTLSICLPSAHAGGSIYIGDENIEHMFLTCTTAQSYAWWYSETKPEFPPIELGYKWVLLYNLVRNTPSAHLVSYGRDATGLVAALGRWKETIPRVQQLVYVLNENYGDDDKPLTLDKLRNENMHRALPLKRACDVTGFHFYLASFTTIVKGDYEEYEEDYYHHRNGWSEEPEHEMGEAESIEHSLERTYSTDGELVALDLPVSWESLLKDHDTEHDEPNEANYEDGIATHYHRKTAIVLVPKERILEFLNVRLTGVNENTVREADGTDTVAPILGFLFRKYHQDASEPLYRRGLEQLSSAIISNNERLLRNKSTVGWKLYTEDTIAEVVQTCLAIHSIALFERAVALFQKPAPLKVFSDIQPLLDTLSLEELGNGLETLIATHKTFQSQASALGVLYPAALTADSTSSVENPLLRNWVVEKMEQFIGAASTLTEKDCEIIFNFTVANGGAQYLSERLIPILVAMVDKTPALVTVLVCLHETGKLLAEFVTDSYQQLVPLVARHYQLANWGRTTSNRRQYSYEDNNMRIPPLFGATLVTFMDRCIAAGLHEDVDIMLAKFEGEASSVHVDDFHPMVLPFLQLLSTRLSTWGKSLTEIWYQSLFRTVLMEYIQRYVQKEPLKPVDWARPPISCDCNDCRAINAFLQNRMMERYEHQMSVARRKHIKQILTRDNSDCIRRDHTDKRPQTLEIIKTTRNYQTDLAEWNTRRQKAATMIFCCDQDALRQLLGDQYQAIAEMRCLESIKLPEITPLTPLSARPQLQPVPPSRLMGQPANVNVKTHANMSSDTRTTGPFVLAPPPLFTKRKADGPPDVVDLS